MHADRYKYWCAFAHYTGRRLAIGTECRILDRPMTLSDVGSINTELQERGFQSATVISFSLFGSPQK